MPDYRFVVNLRSDTFTEPFRESIPAPAYLLAADHATPGMRDLASGVREQGLDPSADNGNFGTHREDGGALLRPGPGLLQKIRTAADLPTRGGAR